MAHEPFHEDIRIEIPGPPLQYHNPTPALHQHDATTPSVQSSPVLINHNKLCSLSHTVLGIPIHRGPGSIMNNAPLHTKIARPIRPEMINTRYYHTAEHRMVNNTWAHDSGPHELVQAAEQLMPVTTWCLTRVHSLSISSNLYDYIQNPISTQHRRSLHL